MFLRQLSGGLPYLKLQNGLAYASGLDNAHAPTDCTHYPTQWGITERPEPRNQSGHNVPATTQWGIAVSETAERFGLCKWARHNAHAPTQRVPTASHTSEWLDLHKQTRHNAHSPTQWGTSATRTSERPDLSTCRNKAYTPQALTQRGDTATHIAEWLDLITHAMTNAHAPTQWGTSERLDLHKRSWLNVHPASSMGDYCASYHTANQHVLRKRSYASAKGRLLPRS